MIFLTFLEKNTENTAERTKSTNQSINQSIKHFWPSSSINQALGQGSNHAQQVHADSRLIPPHQFSALPKQCWSSPLNEEMDHPQSTWSARRSRFSAQTLDHRDTSQSPSAADRQTRTSFPASVWLQTSRNPHQSPKKQSFIKIRKSSGSISTRERRERLMNRGLNTAAKRRKKRHLRAGRYEDVFLQSDEINE